MSDNQIDELLTSVDVLEYLGISKNTMSKLTGEKELPSTEIGASFRFRQTDVFEWLEHFRVNR